MRMFASAASIVKSSPAFAYFINNKSWCKQSWTYKNIYTFFQWSNKPTSSVFNLKRCCCGCCSVFPLV
ncbi:hypothetical protein GE21DRAFT_1043959 [Neurospora crassa]|nr:hypothetical protein GE21DRAFT_1043959 [Neurospora crassa]